MSRQRFLEGPRQFEDDTARWLLRVEECFQTRRLHGDDGGATPAAGENVVDSGGDALSAAPIGAPTTTTTTGNRSGMVLGPRISSTTKHDRCSRCGLSCVFIVYRGRGGLFLS